MHYTIVALLLFFIFENILTKKEYFLRDNFYKVELKIDSDIVTDSNLNIYCFIGSYYNHLPSSKVPPQERTNISYLYGAKIKNYINDKYFKSEKETFALNKTIERSIYVHPNCNTYRSLLDPLSSCTGPPSFVAIFSTGLTKKYYYHVKNFKLKLFIKFKNNKLQNIKIKNNIKESDAKFLKKYSKKIVFSQIKGEVDTLNIFKFINNKVQFKSTKEIDPVNFILMNGIQKMKFK
uniref:Glycosyltransferase family 92 protein n=1 Tax=Strongyloides stercoralis TaxID=6248 RepID=A0A0K0ERH1_STRER